MFTAVRVSMLLLAIAIIVWACVVFIDKQSPEISIPATDFQIDSVNGTIAADSLEQPTGKTQSKKRNITKKKKRKKSIGPRDHLREPIPQGD